MSAVGHEIVNLRRRQQRSVDTRKQIVAGATREFSHLGFDGATTRSIASRAGVQHALVIYHFKTKLEVWQAVMGELIGAYDAQIKGRLASLHGIDDVTGLRLLMEDYIRMSGARPEIHRLMSHEAGEGSERVSWLVDTLIKPTAEVFIPLVKSAQRKGAFVSGDPHHLLYLFIGAASRVFMVSTEVENVTTRSPFEPLFLEEHVQLCLGLFFREPDRKGAHS